MKKRSKASYRRAAHKAWKTKRKTRAGMYPAGMLGLAQFKHTIDLLPKVEWK